MGEGRRGTSGNGNARAAPAELAWIALIPFAAVAAAAILLLGPPLGQALFAPGAERLWPPGWFESQGTPEPVKLGRYLVAAAAPVLLALLVLSLSLAGSSPRLPSALLRALARSSQMLLLAFVVLAVLGQRNVIFVDRPMPDVFGLGTLLAAGAIVPAALLALRRRSVGASIVWLARETTARRVACLGVAAAVAVLWMLQGLLVDGAVEDLGVMEWTVNDAFAVLNGRTPLVDFHLLYAKLLPFPAALAMAVFGDSALVYTLFTTLLSVLALVAVYAIFRRVLGSSLLALGLFVPFVALSDVGHPMTLTAMWPMRYAGAYLMAWLTARHLDGGAPRRAWPLFAVGTVLTVDMMEFGIAALAATLVALLCAHPPRSARAALRLAGEAVGGMLLALAAISSLTLLRAGVLPDPGLLFEWPRIFTRLGWFAIAPPPASLHLAIYATLAAAIVVAAVRLASPSSDRLLTSMLAWSGVFGLLAGSYYVGRSDEFKLAAMFSAWAFALALLTVVVVRALAARGWRHPTGAELLVLFGFALAVCSIVQVPSPSAQISRLVDQPPATYRPAAESFLRQLTRPGEKVAILMPMGHRFAYDLGLDNVAPYGTQDALVTRWQLRNVIDTMRREQAHAIFLFERLTAPEQLELLARAGFTLRAQAGQLIQLSDA